MSLIRWKPLVLDELNENASDFFHLPHHLAASLRDLTTDISEDDKNVYVEVHAPGVDPEKIQAEVRDGHLFLSGEREQKKEHEGRDFYKREIRYGSFERVIPLPAEVDEHKTTAYSEHGLLTVVLPKITTTKEGKKIAIHARK